MTCAGASLLGAHCRVLAGELILSKGGPDPPAAAGGGGDDVRRRGDDPPG